MTIAVMQPYLFPYIGYWQLINKVDCFVIFDDVSFIKKSFINRNSILLNNKSYKFTLEVLGASQNRFINNIEVGNNKSKILKTIQRAYSKAPYFEEVYPLIKKIFEYDEKNLSKFIGYSLKMVSNYLQIDTEFVYSSKINKNNNLKGQDKIIEICKLMGASHYINAIGGQSLYDKNQFYIENINLGFLETAASRYKQFNSEFINNLSILDIMMFNSKENISVILEEYQLI